MSERSLIIVAAVAAAAAAGCNEPTWLQPPRALETKAQMGGGFADDTMSYTIPLRRPSPDEQNVINDEQHALGLAKPVPWVGVRDLAVEIPATVTNLGDAPARAFFTFVGGNEFGNYDPALFVDPNQVDAVAPPPLLGNTPLDLPPHGSVEVLFREDQVAEAALDVEAIVRYPSMPPQSTPFKVLNTHSYVSRVGLEGVPANDVIPQLIVLRPRLSADGDVRASWGVRVRELSARLQAPSAGNLYR
jgi:hypothetical protein